MSEADPRVNPTNRISCAVHFFVQMCEFPEEGSFSSTGIPSSAAGGDPFNSSFSFFVLYVRQRLVRGDAKAKRERN